MSGGALEIAIKYIAHTERFESEVRRKLAEFDPTEVESTISILRLKNILNDRRVTESFCRSRAGRKGIGVYRLEHDLRTRGAPEELIAEFCSGEGEEGKAKTALAAKFVPEPSLKPKAFRFLLSRGFSFEIAHNAVCEFFSEDV